jgi:hypothetical protein
MEGRMEFLEPVRRTVSLESDWMLLPQVSQELPPGHRLDVVMLGLEDLRSHPLRDFRARSHA